MTKNLFFFFEKFLTLKSDQKFFQNFSKKSKIFQIYHLTFSKNIFFEVTNFFEIFFWRKLRCIWPVFKESGMCYYTASYLKSQFCRPGGVVWPFLDPREAKKGKKKGKQTNSWQKNYRQKELQIPGYFAEKNHGFTIISHRATFVYFWRFFLSPHGSTLNFK